MTKDKKYNGVRFSAEVLMDAVNEFKTILKENETKVSYTILRVEHEDANWAYDNFEEFIADYRRFNSQAQLTFNARQYSLSMRISDRDVDISVEAPTRSIIERVYGIFENCLEESKLPPIAKESEKVTETRSIHISKKLVTIENLNALVDVILNSVERDNGNIEEWDISYRADCDGATFESATRDLFDSEKSILTKKNAKNISLVASNYRNRSKIEVEISHGNSSYGNIVVIRGKDPHWVNGTLAAFEETLNSFSPQNDFVATHHSLINVIASVSIGTALLYLLVYLFAPDSASVATSEDSKNKLVLLVESIPLALYIIKYLLAYFIGMIPAHSLTTKLETLWPSVELQIGPEHSMIERQRRIWLSNLVILGILPILTSIIYDLFKGFST